MYPGEKEVLGAEFQVVESMHNYVALEAFPWNKGNVAIGFERRRWMVRDRFFFSPCATSHMAFSLPHIGLILASQKPRLSLTYKQRIFC
jgi:hypothetical protein